MILLPLFVIFNKKNIMASLSYEPMIITKEIKIMDDNHHEQNLSTNTLMDTPRLKEHLKFVSENYINNDLFNEKVEKYAKKYATKNIENNEELKEKHNVDKEFYNKINGILLKNSLYSNDNIILLNKTFLSELKEFLEFSLELNVY